MRLTKVLLVGIVLFMAATITAQDIISVADLSKEMKNKDVLIVCATSNANYKVHITGSVNVPHSDLYNNEPIHSAIKPADEMAKILGSQGVTADKTIVVYDEGSGKYAGRLYWILKYLGAPNVKVLDGGLPAWKANRRPITGSPTKVDAATFIPKVDESVLAKIDEVKKAQGNAAYVLLDTRPADEYSGSADSKIRKGHIPGSVNIDFKNVLDAKGNLKTNDQLKSLFESKGVTADKTIITYCETSVRAGIVFMALKGLGYTKVKVYDGAYYEWQATASNKVE
ncbi:MAG: sulfurtransferase [Bacteroidales bacterium]|nr:sulfurtransferase [Bacteroidales bacterium]